MREVTQAEAPTRSVAHRDGVGVAEGRTATDRGNGMAAGRDGEKKRRIKESKRKEEKEKRREEERYRESEMENKKKRREGEE
jgi:hypothetical protein